MKGEVQLLSDGNVKIEIGEFVIVLTMQAVQDLSLSLGLVKAEHDISHCFQVISMEPIA